MNITQKLTLLTALTSSLILTGCNSVPKRSAGETFRMALKKSVDEDRNYNFSMKQTLTLTPSANKKKVVIEDAGYKPLEQGKTTPSMDDCDKDFDAALADKTLSNTAMEKAEKDYMTCLKATSKNKAGANPLDGLREGMGSKLKDVKGAMTPGRINAINEYWLKPMTIELNGAVDADSKRVLMDYRFAYKPQNFTLAVNFPLLLDFNEMSIALDPAIALPVLGPVFEKEVGTSWQGKWIKFTLPEEFKKDIPTDIILRSLMKSIQLSYGGIDDKFVSYAEKNTLTRELGASHAVKVNMPPKQQILLLDRFLTNWVSELEKEAKANPKSINNPKQFNMLLDMAKEMTKNDLSEMLNSEEVISLLVGDTDYTFFLNGSNRMVGMLNTQKMTALADIINADINSRTVMTMTNHNHADFSLVPSKENIIDGNALIEKFADMKNPLSSKPSDRFDNDTASAVTVESADEAVVEGVADAATADNAAAPTALMIEPNDAIPTEIDDAQRNESRSAFCKSNPRYAKSKACKNIN